jgi:hypothetical protein
MNRERLRSRRYPLAVAALLAALAATVIHALMLRVSFVSDDFIFLYFVRHAGAADLWRVFAPQPSDIPRGGFYRPVGILLWSAGYWVGGLDPLPQRLLAVGLHVANVVLVLALGRAVGLGGRAAAAGAAIFALFPTQAEAVSWLSGRFDLASLTFTLLYLLCGIRDGLPAHLAALACLCLALGSKEAAVTAPALLLLLLAVRSPPRGAEDARALLVGLAPSALVVAAYLGLRLTIFGGLGGYVLNGRNFAESAGPLDYALAWWRFLPALLAPISPGLLLDTARALAPGAWLLALAAAALALGAVARAPIGDPPVAPWRALAFGAGWVAAASLPLASADSPNMITFEATRYGYLPSVGVALAIGAALAPGRQHPPSARAARFALLAGVLALSAATVAETNQRWVRASASADSIVADLMTLYPDPPPQTTFVLPNLPDNERGAYVFRNGAPEALRLAYDSSELHVTTQQLLTPQLLPRPDRVAVAGERGGSLVRDPADRDLLAYIAQTSEVPGMWGVSFEGDFFPPEYSDTFSWRWMRTSGCLNLEMAAAQRVDITMRLLSPGPQRQVRIARDGRELAMLTVGAHPQEVALRNLDLAPGSNPVCITPDGSAPVDGDPRWLSVAVVDMSVHLSPLLAAPPQPAAPLAARFAEQVELLGYDLEPPAGYVRPEQRVAVTLYWRCDEAPPAGLLAYVHLRDSSGRTVAQADAPPGGPTADWRPGQYLRGRFTLALPPGLPAGDYTLVTGLYDPATMERVPLRHPGSPDDGVILRTLKLETSPQIWLW